MSVTLAPTRRLNHGRWCADTGLTYLSVVPANAKPQTLGQFLTGWSFAFSAA